MTIHSDSRRRTLRALWVLALLAYVCLGTPLLIMSALVPLLGAVLTLPLLLGTRAVIGVPGGLPLFLGIDQAALAVFFFHAPQHPIPRLPLPVGTFLFFACLLWPVLLSGYMIRALRPIRVSSARIAA